MLPATVWAKYRLVNLAFVGFPRISHSVKPMLVFQSRQQEWFQGFAEIR